MAKKKKPQPKDDLIDQLLNDVNDIAADDSLADLSDESSGNLALGLGADNDGDRPFGLPGDDAKVIEATRVHDGESPWDNLEKNLDGVPDLPASEDSVFKGPSAGDGGYQSIDDLNVPATPGDSFESAEGMENEATRPLGLAGTKSLAQMHSDDSDTGAASAGGGDHEATLAADGFALRRKPTQEPQEKVVIGSLRGSRAGNVLTTMDASLAQAENLKLAQQKILDLEKENDRLRQENEEVSSAAEIIRNRLEELSARITVLEREKSEIQDSAQNEIMILKGNLQYKESEVAKARLKIDELDTRLRNDFKKIRVKERELENRLELARAEKVALVRAKDENILELKRKIDQLQSEIDNYREKCLELNKTIEVHQDQFKRTVRALRLALTNLEAKDDNLISLKKAE